MGCCTVGSWASPLSVPVRIVSDGNALHSIPSAPIAPSRGAEDVGGVHGRSEGHSPHKDVHVNPRWKWRLVIAYDGTKYAASCGFLLSLLGQFSIASWVLRFEPNSFGEQETVHMGVDQVRDKWLYATEFFSCVSGWQFQQRPATVQYMVEKALSKFTKLARDELCLVGASRTDAGVHAWGQGANLQLEVEGSGFFYKQVRSMVGLLLEVGKEALPPDIVLDVLASCDRRILAKYAVTAPPYGLCLMSVSYTDTDLEPPTGSPSACFGRHHQISKCIVTYY